MSGKSPLPPPSDFHHYLPISDDLMHGGFYVTSCGASTLLPGETYPKAQHPQLYNFTWTEGRTLPEFSLLLVTAGSGCFDSRETGVRNVDAGQALLLIPGLWHRYRPDPNTGWTEKWIQFNGLLAHQLLDQHIFSTAQPLLRPADFPAVETAIEGILQRVHQQPTTNSLRLSLQVMAALSLVVGESPVVPAIVAAPAAARRHTDDLVISALDYIWTRSHHVLSVPDVAAAIGATRRTLERRVMAALGHSVLDEIIRCRFSRAERLLRSTDLPIKTVVTLSGFGSLENMRQVFLTRAKVSPGAYRDLHDSRRAEFAL